MKKTRVVLAGIALAALAATLAFAADPASNYPGRDREVWRSSWYAQKHAEPGPRIPTPPPKDPVGAPASAHQSNGMAGDAAGVAIGFGGGRAGKRTARELERDSVRKTIRNLG